MSGAQLFAGVLTSPRAAQPFAVQEVGTGGFAGDQGRSEVGNGLAVVLLGLGPFIVNARERASRPSAHDVPLARAQSSGGARELTANIDGDGAVRALEATRLAGVNRVALVSVLPEAGRGRHLSEDEEFSVAVKKLVDVTVSSSDLDWLILELNQGSTPIAHAVQANIC